MNKVPKFLFIAGVSIFLSSFVVTPASAKGGSTGPAAPVLSATVVECCHIDFTWTEASCSSITSYELHRNFGSSTNGAPTLKTVSPGCNLSAYDKTVNASTTYTYFLVAIAGASRSPNSNPVTITTTVCGAPTPPINLQINRDNSSCHKSLVSWANDSCQACTYTVERADDAAFTVNVVSYTTSNLSLTDSWLAAPNVKYYYRVKACNPSLLCSVWSTTSTFTTFSCTTTP